MPFPALSADVTSAWQVPMQAVQQGQADLPDASRRLWTSWMERRQEALETGVKALFRMATCETPRAMSAVCNEWVAQIMQRITVDMNEARDLACRVAEAGQEAAGQLFRAGRGSLEQTGGGVSAPGRARVRATGLPGGEGAAGDLAPAAR